MYMSYKITEKNKKYIGKNYIRYLKNEKKLKKDRENLYKKQGKRGRKKGQNEIKKARKVDVFCGR